LKSKETVGHLCTLICCETRKDPVLLASMMPFMGKRHVIVIAKCRYLVAVVLCKAKLHITRTSNTTLGLAGALKGSKWRLRTASGKFWPRLRQWTCCHGHVESRGHGPTGQLQPSFVLYNRVTCK